MCAGPLATKRCFLKQELLNSLISDAALSERWTDTVGYARTNIIGSRNSLVIAFFVLVYIEIYVFRGNPFQAHSLVQSHHPDFSLYFAGSNYRAE